MILIQQPAMPPSEMLLFKGEHQPLRAWVEIYSLKLIQATAVIWLPYNFPKAETPVHNRLYFKHLVWLHSRRQ